MKVVKYSSIHVDSVDQKEIDSQLRGDTLIMGLDVAKKKEYAALADETGKDICVLYWEHPRNSRKFADFIDRLKPSRVQMVMEPTGTYGDPLRHLAYERDWEVWKMAPKRVGDAKEIADGVPSIHDSKAAHILVWLHKQGLTERWEPKRVSRRRVKTLIRQLSRLQENWQRHLGYLEAGMARYWPEIIQAWELKRATLLGILINFGGPQKIVENEEEVRAYMKKKGGPFLKQKRINEVIKVAHNSLGVSTLKSERVSLKNLAEHADRLRRDRKKFKQKLDRTIEQPEVRRIGGEVGLPTAALFWDKLGSFKDYHKVDQLIKAFGLNLKEKSSGTYNSPLHITKRGPSDARASLYLATCRKINTDPHFQAWHREKVARDGGEDNANKNVSVVALMRKYVMGLWHLARGKEFDSTLLFDTDKLKTQKSMVAASMN
ncbi:transposase [Candidatus Bipolaricaulota bacterium]|nr:transposase [Candidatus Bipolaricaulota bacterium]